MTLIGRWEADRPRVGKRDHQLIIQLEQLWVRLGIHVLIRMVGLVEMLKYCIKYECFIVCPNTVRWVEKPSLKCLDIQ